MNERVVRTTCPDPFSCDAGIAPPGHACATRTGPHGGYEIQHHIIPAICLKPAHPAAKNQLCLVIKGPRSGEVLSLKQCKKNAGKIVAQDGIEMLFDEVCLTFPSGVH